METTINILKITASVLLSLVALVSLLRALYLQYRLWFARGQSYGHVARTVAGLNLAAGISISLVVFLWNPVILLLPVLLGMSLFWALLMYESVASPYRLANWLRKTMHDRESPDENRS
jgi:asparagine N-glycosylation enzyme membrane subunit Stt3